MTTDSPLWSAEEFLTAVGGRERGEALSDITGISIDSRTVQAGEAFFAIAGDRFDGHDFAGKALDAGAATAVVAETETGKLDGVSGHMTVVPDVMDALRDLARASRARSAGGIVAVTGSVGKTGTKEMLAAALRGSGSVHASVASFNNHWGVPLTLSRMPAGVAYGVFEIGMNHAGEITPLTRMVRPQVAIITTVEPVHLEHFDDVTGIARAKAEIFLGVEPGGLAIINRDNPHFDLLAALAREAGVERVAGFGEHEGADIRLLDVSLKEDSSSVRVSVFGKDIAYKLAIPGRHVVQNSLAVMGAVSALDADLARAGLALAELPPPTGRGRRYQLSLAEGAATLIDESYNANPASMEAAIGVLAATSPKAGGRRIAVLGDMLELGEDSPKLHADLAPVLERAAIDSVFAAGPLMKNLYDALPSYRRGGYSGAAEELEASLIRAVSAGDVIMVKGSNGSRLGPVVASLRNRFAGDDETAIEKEDA